VVKGKKNEAISRAYFPPTVRESGPASALGSTAACFACDHPMSGTEWQVHACPARESNGPKRLNKNTGQSPHRSIGERTDAAFYFASPTTTWPFLSGQNLFSFHAMEWGNFSPKASASAVVSRNSYLLPQVHMQDEGKPRVQVARAVAPANFRCPIIGRRGSCRGCYDSRTTRAHASACSREKSPLPMES